MSTREITVNSAAVGTTFLGAINRMLQTEQIDLRNPELCYTRHFNESEYLRVERYEYELRISINDRSLQAPIFTATYFYYSVVFGFLLASLLSGDGLREFLRISPRLEPERLYNSLEYQISTNKRLEQWAEYIDRQFQQLRAKASDTVEF